VVLERLLLPGPGLDSTSLAANTRRIAAERLECMATQPDVFLTATKMFDPRDRPRGEKPL
jgi:hypothetical protein